MSIQTRLIEYEHEDKVLEGKLAWDSSIDGPMPGVMVCHAWGGRSEFENDRAEELAKFGYAGFALDLYGKGVLGSGPDENAVLMQPFLDDRAMLQERLLSSLQVMRGQPEVDASRTAAIGYCFGGLCVLDIARTGEDLGGVVSLHGLFAAPGNTSGNSIKAKVLALHGWNDPMAPPDAVFALAEELTSMGADWQLHGYGNTMHAFTNPQANNPDFGTVYSASADRRSWTAVRNFLAELFGA
jgi:dienelactone hydrolase